MRPGDDPREEVAREVREADEVDELARERAGEQEEADGADGPGVALELGDEARRGEEEAEERDEDEAPGRGASTRSLGAWAAPLTWPLHSRRRGRGGTTALTRERRPRRAGC